MTPISSKTKDAPKLTVFSTSWLAEAESAVVRVACLMDFVSFDFLFVVVVVARVENHLIRDLQTVGLVCCEDQVS